MVYLAHRNEETGETQTIQEHLQGTAKYAKAFAGAFGAADWGNAIGMMHDIGKYSTDFQRRIRGENVRAEHSTPGAIELRKKYKKLGIPAAFCVAGHHGGMPNGGSSVDGSDEPTLHGRLMRTFDGSRSYQAFAEEMEVPDANPAILQRFLKQSATPLYSISFFTHMLFSCLVDADFLDTEWFMHGGKKRTYQYDSISCLCDRLERKFDEWSHPDSPINEKRCEIAEDCLRAAKWESGLFRLTVPTGGGKTMASMRFALNHAIESEKCRVIYVIPYTSVIDQNAREFAKVLGENNVLEHHANVNYDNTDETMQQLKRLSAENWDAPIVVTTNVQFFESLYANKPSRCRKLHNIANSVIVFDEAQMLPRGLLRPCVRAIEELTENYGCTAVLCTATQPALDDLFETGHMPREICRDPKDLYTFFRRVRFDLWDGVPEEMREALQRRGEPQQWDDEQVRAHMEQCEQVLCIVNSRKQAQTLYAMLPEEGRFHLSTLMTPTDRRQTLDCVRERLRNGEICRLISTSLVEAGVDVDFPAVFRAMAGLDSIIQAAGRCNREGKRARENSVVSVFRPEARYDAHMPPSLKKPKDSAQAVLRMSFDDISSLDAVDAYFHDLFDVENLDEKNILEMIQDAGLDTPYVRIAEQFRVIEENTVDLMIPLDEGEALADRLAEGERSRELLRQAGQYMIHLYPNQLEKLVAGAAVQQLDDQLYLLTDLQLYSRTCGLSLDVEQGVALFH